MDRLERSHSRLTWTQHLLRGWIRIVTRIPYLSLLICLFLVSSSIYVSVARLHYKTQRDDLMSAERQCQQRWHRYLQQFGHDDDIVVVVEGTQSLQMKQAIEFLAEQLRKEANFDRLFYKMDLTNLQNRSLLHLSYEELDGIDQQLAHLGPLLGIASRFAWDQLTFQNMLLQTDAVVQKWNQGYPLSDDLRRLLNQFQSHLHSLNALLLDSDAYQSPWNGFGNTPRADPRANWFQEAQYFFSPDQSLAFLLIRPIHEDQQSFTPGTKAVQTIRELLLQAKQIYPDCQFGVTGLPVLENDEMRASEEDSTFASWLALAGVAVMYFVVYRSFRYPFLTILTLVTGTVWALGLTALTIGYLTILSSTFAVMLIGMGDYGVLWVARYEQERKHGFSTQQALLNTAEHNGISILTAAITTSLAFFATMLADFQAVAELGFIAGCGVLLCALSCFTVLPAMLMILEGKPKTSVDNEDPYLLPYSHPRWLPQLSKRPRTVLIGSGILFLIAGCLSQRLEYDHNLLHMQAKDLESVTWEMKLLEKTTGANWSALSIADSKEEALNLANQYRQSNQVSQVLELASLIPSQQAEKLPLLSSIQQKLQLLPTLQSVQHPTPKFSVIQEQLRDLRKQLPLIPKDEWKGLLLEVTELEASLRSRSQDQVLATIMEFDRKASRDLLTQLHQLRSVSQPQRIQLNDLPVELRERYVSPQGQWLVRVFAKDNLWEFDALERFVQEMQRIDPEVTGKPFGTLEGLKTMKSGFEWAALYAFLAIVLILWFDFRQVSGLALVLLPLICGVVFTLGILQLGGYPLNPANLIALPLIVGVGVDNGLHVLHDYRERKAGTIYLMSYATGKGITVAAFTTLLGFGTLMISRHVGLHSLGLTLALGVGCCMICALIILPAILYLIDERLLAITKVDKQQEKYHKQAA